MGRLEAIDQYNTALREGKKFYKTALSRGEYPYPQVLDELVDPGETAGVMNLGALDIPIERVVGTKTEGRKQAFAANFMPLFPAESEFAAKWVNLCEANLSSEGIRDPILCYEYRGRFYVQEGNKRVSVLKSFGAPTITAIVKRLIPVWSDDEETRCYYEFMDFYRLSGCYLAQFDRLGAYRALQLALGFDPEHVWTEDERREFSGLYFELCRALRRETLRGGETVSEILLHMLQVFGRSELREMTEPRLLTAFERIRPELALRGMENAINVSMTSEEEKPQSVLARIRNTILPTHITAAFIHECPPERSSWIKAHEYGREYLEKTLPDAVSTRSYIVSADADEDERMEQAIREGAQVIFATSPRLILACRRCALNHPEVRVLNCSVSMPFPEVRTYYSRIYEGKFISGAVAGALTKTDRLGYSASNPIYGVPAGINAFALGAKLTNPDAKIYLRWSSTSVDTFSELKALGVDMISSRDIPTPEQEQKVWGLSSVNENGELTPILSPYWNWGEIYVRLVRGLLAGGWDDPASRGQAVNYWWGMSSGAVDLHESEAMPESTAELVTMLKKGIASGTVDPFFRKIRAQDGRVINDGTRWLSPEEILYMDWLCDCVEGHIPHWDELLPIAHKLVKLQGIFHDEIPSEMGDIPL